MKLERAQRKENCCTACNSKHQCVLQCIVAGVRSARLTRLRDNRVGGGIGICIDKTIADVGSVYNRNVLLALVNLDLEGNGECVARSNVLSPSYSTRSWVVGAAVISGAINVSCVLWDDIGYGDIASGVGGVGVSYGVSEHLTSSYLVAIDGVTLTVQDILLWLRQNYPNANKVSVLVVDDLGIVIVTDEYPSSVWSLNSSNAAKWLIRGNSGSVRNSGLLARKQV